MPTIDRPTLIAALRRAVHDDPDVRAAWEGGSAAFAADDALSDVDLLVVARDGSEAAVFERIEAALEALSPIALRVEIPPQPTYLQRFYRLRDAGEFLVVDLVLMRAGAPLGFREVELHGQGQTWLDRDGCLAEAHVDPVADLEAARRRVPVLCAQFEMFQHLARKERLRGRAVEALAFYQANTLRPLVEALRLLQVPQRRGFGLRYLARDLPAAWLPLIERLSYVRDLDDLAACQALCERLFAACREALETQGPGAGLQQLAEPSRWTGELQAASTPPPRG